MATADKTKVTLTVIMHQVAYFRIDLSQRKAQPPPAGGLVSQEEDDVLGNATGKGCVMKSRIGVAVLAGAFAALLPLAAGAAGMNPIKSETQTAHYRLALQIGPTEKMVSLADVAAKHPTDGEVMVGGKMSSMDMSMGMADTRHLEIHVYALDGGKVVTDADVAIALTNSDTKKVEDVPSAKMYGIKEGPSDTHFGNNVSMPPGPYNVGVSVNGEKAEFSVVVPPA